MKKILIVIAFAFIACTDSTDPEKQSEFDRSVFLENYATNHVIPGFQELGIAVADLDVVIQNTGNSSDFNLAQESWKAAYLSFLQVNALNFGPAGEEVLRKSLVEEVGTFPVNIGEVEARIAASNFDMADFQRDARGFLALEYLLFSEKTDLSANRLAYAKAVSAHLKTEIERINTEWPGFKAEFVANDGTAAGSSTSVFYNEFVKSFEALKNFKVGLPLGLRPGQTAAVPENVESLYAGYSKDFAEAHFENIKQLWIGSNSVGFKDYLMTVEGGPALVTSTENQIREVEVAFESVSNEDFLPQNLDNNTSLVALHTELQKLTRFFKSEMSSVLGIAITFSSGDGD